MQVVLGRSLQVTLLNDSPIAQERGRSYKFAGFPTKFEIFFSRQRAHKRFNSKEDFFDLQKTQEKILLHSERCSRSKEAAQFTNCALTI